MKSKILIVIVLAIIAASCSNYEKLLKSSDYALKYAKAFEYYENEEYVKSANLFEQISSIYRGTNKADTVQYYKAQSYLKQRDYVMAGHYFSELFTTFPNSPFAEESAFLDAFCEYKQSPRPSLDQSNTYKAISKFRLFLIRNPGSNRAEEALAIIFEMEEKLVQKSFMGAKLYYDLGAYNSAIIALRNSLNEYPDTKFREELMFMILKSYYLLAVNSIEEKKLDRYQAAVDEYFSFVGEFGTGPFSTEAKRFTMIL
jgi:outer membrane protein assembly factor BamD